MNKFSIVSKVFWLILTLFSIFFHSIATVAFSDFFWRCSKFSLSVRTSIIRKIVNIFLILRFFVINSVDAAMIIGKLHIVARNIATSSICRQVKAASFDKQVKMMKKVMAGREKGKRRWTFHDGMTKMETAKQISDPKGQRKPFAKRVVVLNKLFMKNVSDMLATDAFAKDILGYGLQVSWWFQLLRNSELIISILVLDHKCENGTRFQICQHLLVSQIWW